MGSKTQEKVDTPLQRVFDLFVWVYVLRIQPRALRGKYATSPGPNYLMSSKNIIVHLWLRAWTIEIHCLQKGLLSVGLRECIMGLAFESFLSLLSYSVRTVQEWWHFSRCSAQRTCAHAPDRAGSSLKNLERGNVTRSVWASHSCWFTRFSSAVMKEHRWLPQPHPGAVVVPLVPG